MSSYQKRMFLLQDDTDLFLEFLGSYHEVKWENNGWYDLDCEIQHSGGKFMVEVFAGAITPMAKKCKMKFTKYIQYQLSQYTDGKSEIVSSFGLYKKIYGKKTREVSVQTEVSLDQNKKYYGPKVL